MKWRKPRKSSSSPPSCTRPVTTDTGESAYNFLTAIYAKYADGEGKFGRREHKERIGSNLLSLRSSWLIRSGPAFAYFAWFVVSQSFRPAFFYVISAFFCGQHSFSMFPAFGEFWHGLSALVAPGEFFLRRLPQTDVGPRRWRSPTQNAEKRRVRGPGLQDCGGDSP